MPNRNAISQTPEPHAAAGWRLRLKERLGWLDGIRVIAYRSCGTPHALRVRGRVVEQRGLHGTTEAASVWRNAWNALQRLKSTEIPGARLRAHLGGGAWETSTDHEGYFIVDIVPSAPLTPGWHEIRLELLESIGEPVGRFACGSVLVPSPEATFAVVSDVDDTVIKTRSTDLLRMLAIFFGKGAHDRTAVPGMSAFYRALAGGPDGRGHNPTFYVSRSSWNLYDLFEECMDVNELPRGPIFLRDVQFLDDAPTLLGSDRHKFDSIDQLLRTYPELPFILIGDSGMHDPELYRELATKHPGRVRAVYIHDVSSAARDEEVQQVAADLAAQGVPLLCAPHTRYLAEHAAGEGWISPNSLAEIRRGVDQDEAERSG